MKITMDMSCEELAELEGLLEREIASTRIELRRTDHGEYRKRVSHQLEMLEHLHEAAAQAEARVDLTIG